MSQISRGAEVLMYDPTDLIKQVTTLDQTNLDKNWRSRHTVLAQVAYQIGKMDVYLDALISLGFFSVTSVGVPFS